MLLHTIYRVSTIHCLPRTTNNLVLAITYKNYYYLQKKYKWPFLLLRIRHGHPVRYYIAAEVCMTGVFPYSDPCVGFVIIVQKNAFIFALLTTFFHYYTIIYSFACTLLMQLFSQNRITIPIFDHENNPSH